MKVVFAHGWGFDGSVWKGVAAHLPGRDVVVMDRGYFGAAVSPQPDAPWLGVGHSFGVMALLAAQPDRCRGLIAINGFDRFGETADRPGIAPRVLDRMIARFAGDPLMVLNEFRVRVGAAPVQHIADPQALRADLLALRDDDRRAQVAQLGVPVLAIDGADDPLLPAAMRDAQFDGVSRLARECVAGAGHCLPLTHPALCAQRIAAMIALHEKSGPAA